MKRRDFLKRVPAGILAAGGFTAIAGCGMKTPKKRPNLLFAISDDQSWPYAGAYGAGFVNTPAFDRVAREGVLFTNAFCAAPQCSPNRAALLTSRNIWQLEEAGTHNSHFPKKYAVFTDLLESAGYTIGYTGKPWGPGNWEISGWKRNPAGPEFNEKKISGDVPDGISSNDYAGNFESFMDARPENSPFFFWFGCQEPHRSYERGSGKRAGKRPEAAELPPFLPDNETVRSDMLDYAIEIEWFDRHLGRMLDILDRIGELDNTLVLVTSDNGMPFPKAKANLYEYGIHVPMAAMWRAESKGGRTADDLISFTDIAPTFLEAAGVQPDPGMTGISFLNRIPGSGSPSSRTGRSFILAGRERHSHARADNLGYPSRAVRTDRYLYIRNFKPDRWPAGDPVPSGETEGFHDIDGSPTKTWMMEHMEADPLCALAFTKRPEEELFDLRKDPGCLSNLAGDREHAAVLGELRGLLEKELTDGGDPRMLGYGDIFESYPRYASMRDLPGFKERGEVNTEYRVEKPVKR